MSDIEIFNFESHDVRVVLIDGEPWWVVNDVCAAIGIGNPRMAAERLDPDDVSQADVIDSMGRKQSTNVVNEGGLYDLILRSDKPTARPFRKWVTEKIKELRKYGVATIRPMSPAELLVAQAQQLLDIERQLAADKAANERVHAEQEARFQALESNYGRVTALGYVKLRGLLDGVGFLNYFGRVAGRVGREQGLPVEKAHSTVFGDVNTWPEDVWDEALRRMPSSQ